MQNNRLTRLPYQRLSAFLVLLLLALIPPMVQAFDEPTGQLNSFEERPSLSLEPTFIAETWQSGFTIEGPLSYNAIIGRTLGEAVFRSRREADIYYAFPGSATATTVKMAQFSLDNPTGNYPGQVALSLEIHTYAGDAYRTISLSNIDWQSAPPGDWLEVELDATVNRQIGPGEFLAFHINFVDGSGGSLELRPKFRIDVETSFPTGKDLPITEIWRSGYTVEGSPVYDENLKRKVRAEFTSVGTPTYNTTLGRRISTVGTFRANRNVSDIYYLFPVATSASTVQAIQYHILSRTGTYHPADVNLSFAIYDNEGWQQPISGNINLKAAETEQWLSVADLATVTMAPGQFLAAQVSFEAGSAGDLDLRLQFEVDVSQSPSQRQYLPLVN